MIIFATIIDEERDSKRGPARKVRYRMGLGVDNYNVIIAETTGEKWGGRLFYGSLAQVSRALIANDYPEDVALQATRKGLQRIAEMDLSQMSWEEMDVALEVSKRKKDASGLLILKETLKEAGYTDDQGENGKEEESDDVS